jgi:hypothetical protein
MMQGQENVGKARMIGYAVGMAAFIVVVLWKFVVR